MKIPTRAKGLLIPVEREGHVELKTRMTEKLTDRELLEQLKKDIDIALQSEQVGLCEFTEHPEVLVVKLRDKIVMVVKKVRAE